MKLSVVIPTFNRPRQLRDLLASLSTQDLSHREFEVLVVSNLPDARLIPIVGEMERRGLNVVLLTNSLIGVNRARNQGLANCRGEIVLLLDDDCELPSTAYLSRVLEVHQQHPHVLAIGGSYQDSPNVSHPSRAYNQICNSWIHHDDVKLTQRLLGGCVAYKLAPLIANGLRFDESIDYGGSETEFHNRLQEQGFQLLFHPELSVIHNCTISIFELLKKSFWQGFRKGERKFLAPPNEFLPAGIYQHIYAQSFAAGEYCGERSQANSTTTLKLVRWLLAFALNSLLKKIGERPYWIGYALVTRGMGRMRSFGSCSYWRVRGGLDGCWRSLNKTYWLAYGVLTRRYWNAYRCANCGYWLAHNCVSRTYWGSRRVSVIGYWQVHGRITKGRDWTKQLYWSVYGYLNRFYWVNYSRTVRAYWTVYRAYWTAHRAVVSTYWRIHRLRNIIYWFAHHQRTRLYWFFRHQTTRIYWIAHHLVHRIFVLFMRIRRAIWMVGALSLHVRRHWHSPHHWLALRLPVALPNFSTAGEPTWAVHLDSAEERRWQEWRVLGINSVEWAQGREPIDVESVSALASHYGLKCSTVLQFPQESQESAQTATLTVSVIQEQTEKCLRWLSTLNNVKVLRLELDDLIDIQKLRIFLEKIPVREAAVVIPSAQSGGFELFERFSDFSRATDGLDIKWRPYYFYRPANHCRELESLVSPAALKHRGQRPEISVIIPHHQDFENLRAAVKCLSQQTLAIENFEVIVIDNACKEFLLKSEEREELIELAKDMRLTLLTLEAQTPDVFLAGYARNRGRMLATGGIIQFMDSDILLPQNFLAQLVVQMKTMDVVMAKRHMLGEKHTPELGLPTTMEHTYLEDAYWEGFKRARHWTDLSDYWKYSCTYCFAVKRDALITAGPFDPLFTQYGFEDVDLAFRLFQLRKKFAFARDYVFHLYPAQKTHNYHFDAEKRLKSLTRSALTFFLIRPERATFALCQGYFAPLLTTRMKQWLTRSIERRAV